MDEKNDDIAHTPNANRASEDAGIHADLVIRHQQESSLEYNLAGLLDLLPLLRRFI